MAKRAHSRGRSNTRARQQRPRVSSPPARPASAAAAPPTPVSQATRPARAGVGAATRTPAMDYSYVKHDLIRIGVLAVVLMGAMGALAFMVR